MKFKEDERVILKDKKDDTVFLFSVLGIGAGPLNWENWR